MCLGPRPTYSCSKYVIPSDTAPLIPTRAFMAIPDSQNRRRTRLVSLAGQGVHHPRVWQDSLSLARAVPPGLLFRASARQPDDLPSGPCYFFQLWYHKEV
jgi:hypothetical protein